MYWVHLRGSACQKLCLSYGDRSGLDPGLAQGCLCQVVGPCVLWMAICGSVGAQQWPVLSIIPTSAVEDNCLTHSSQEPLPAAPVSSGSHTIRQVELQSLSLSPVQPQPSALKSVCVLLGSLPHGGGQGMSDFQLWRRSPSCCVRGEGGGSNTLSPT